MEYTFIKHYYENDVNTTFSYPFEVEGDIDSIEIFIDVWQAKKPEGQRPDLVGVGLRHKGIVRAWNCTHKTYMLLGQEYGTPGTLPGKLDKGTWEVIVFPRTKNKIEHITVTTTVKINNKKLRFVKGDPHIHTYHSDGHHSIEDNAKYAKELGLDYIFMADHNISSANRSIPVDQGILIGQGVEYGLEAGHALLLGEERPVDDFTWDPEWSCYKGHLDEARQRGAYIGINHPFWEDTSWDVGFDHDHDWVEIWNGVWRPHNEKALKWWHEQLCAGKRIPVVGGSDFHQRGGHTIGMPTTHAQVDVLTTKAILEAYKSGHVYLTRDPKGPSLSFTSGHVTMGEESNNSQAHIEVKELSGEAYKLYLITDKSSDSYDLGTDDFQMDVSVEGAKFLRVEVRDEHERMILISNPIYFAHM